MFTQNHIVENELLFTSFELRAQGKYEDCYTVNQLRSRVLSGNLSAQDYEQIIALIMPAIFRQESAPADVVNPRYLAELRAIVRTAAAHI